MKMLELNSELEKHFLYNEVILKEVITAMNYSTTSITILKKTESILLDLLSVMKNASLVKINNISNKRKFKEFISDSFINLFEKMELNKNIVGTINPPDHKLMFSRIHSSFLRFLNGKHYIILDLENLKNHVPHENSEYFIKKLISNNEKLHELLTLNEKKLVDIT